MVLSGPDAQRMSQPPALERLLGRDGAITLAGVLLLCALAWGYLVTGAGMGMGARQMTTLALFPHRAGAAMAGMAMAPPDWTPTTWVLVVGMWWAMMLAMMAPSAAPAILLHARVHRHALAQGRLPGRLAGSGLFVAGYLLTWLAFSVAAAALQFVLERAGIVQAMAMGARVAWLSATVLIVAGLYQFSPLKRACLSHCRAPAPFLSHHWRSDRWNPLHLGLRHGAYCVGCYWVLMALLFVGGVMNLVWIAALSLLVLAEKVLPIGRGVGIATGVVLLAWGIATLFV
ncbi:MAG: DUF2182 domain-containing protein [Burkholderiaceae bacterium]